jgi:two-component system CheB/CheR fusion protein
MGVSPNSTGQHLQRATMGSAGKDRREIQVSTPFGLAEDLAAPPDGPPRARLPLPVTGLGASAGGVEALQRFFTATPPCGGMVCVLIQHLSPEHKSLMVGTLSRCTSMSVHRIEEGRRIAPGHVHLIRPGRPVTLRDRQVRMSESLEKRCHGHPVDHFFRSLAREQRERAIALVLSGRAPMAAPRAKAIKAAGGPHIARDP